MVNDMGEEIIATSAPAVSDAVNEVYLTAVTDLLDKIYTEFSCIEYLLSLIFGILCFTLGFILIIFFINFIKNSLFSEL